MVPTWRKCSAVGLRRRATTRPYNAFQDSRCSYSRSPPSLPRLLTLTAYLLQQPGESTGIDWLCGQHQRHNGPVGAGNRTPLVAPVGESGIVQRLVGKGSGLHQPGTFGVLGLEQILHAPSVRKTF